LSILALIRAAFEGLAAIPRILEFFKEMRLAERLASLEKAQAEIKISYDELYNANTSDQIKKALASRRAAINKL